MDVAIEDSVINVPCAFSNTGDNTGHLLNFIPGFQPDSAWHRLICFFQKRMLTPARLARQVSGIFLLREFDVVKS